LPTRFGGLDAFYGPVFRAGILFHAYTGLRSGEFCGLEWDDLAGDELHVQRQVRADGTVGLPKTDRKRTIIVPEVAQDALRSVPRKFPWMFPTVSGEADGARVACLYVVQHRQADGRPA
jgi:integrase